VVTDATLRVRDRLIWGEGTNACASDSKHFGAWDQNLTTQWHVRYGGRGVMIYWHVDRNSLCIHSQIKSPSSSEVERWSAWSLQRFASVKWIPCRLVA